MSISKVVATGNSWHAGGPAVTELRGARNWCNACTGYTYHLCHESAAVIQICTKKINDVANSDPRKQAEPSWRAQACAQGL